MDGLVYSSAGPWLREQGQSKELAGLLSKESLSSATAVEKLNELSRTLRAGVEPLKDVRQAVALQEELLRHIPNRWPVVAGRGHVTMEYGPNIHPILDHWYLHKGMDITDTPGVPVVSSAAGRVIKAEYDQFGYGWNIIIEHKYGFKTRYGHLQRVLVDEGQSVDSGERIGVLGNTGTSTGPHVHFEVLLGDDVLDPAAFLKISNEFRRWRGNRS
jgi:murein DD-endopeptidase MepM/ murein hydrolase activator NlpD